MHPYACSSTWCADNKDRKKNTYCEGKRTVSQLGCRLSFRYHWYVLPKKATKFQEL